MKYFNCSDLSNRFSKMVRDINTRNPKWNECIKEINYQIEKYLDSEVFQHNIIQYKLEINMIGQSIIECNIKYIERYFEPYKELNFKERVKTPKEVCQSILYAVENVIIKKVSNYEC